MMFIVRPTLLRAENGYWESPDRADAAWVSGHRGLGDHRSHVYSTQRTTDFVLSVHEHQWER